MISYKIVTADDSGDTSTSAPFVTTEDRAIGFFEDALSDMRLAIAGLHLQRLITVRLEAHENRGVRVVRTETV